MASAGSPPAAGKGAAREGPCFVGQGLEASEDTMLPPSPPAQYFVSGCRGGQAWGLLFPGWPSCTGCLWWAFDVTAALCPQLPGLPPSVSFAPLALRREVECLTKEHTETRQQSEKDRSALLSQMKVLEAELEEQLARHQACARQAEELCALRQQMESLDKHLRSQRQFMDVRTWTAFVHVTGGHLCSVSFSPRH